MPLSFAELERFYRNLVARARAHLPLNPLTDFGVDRMIENARSRVAELVNAAALDWLPDVREHFKLLS